MIHAKTGLAVLVALVVAGAQENARILSNDLLIIAGGGEYLWMLSAKGLNYTTAAFDDSLEWREVPSTKGTEFIGPLVHGGKRVLAGVAPPDEQHGDLVLFHQDGRRDERVSIPYDVNHFKDSLDKQEPLFMAWDAAWGAGAFWVAMIDGGVARIQPGSDNAAVTLRMPGVAGHFSPAAFTPDALGEAPGDPAHRPYGVAVDTATSIVWVMCEERLWTLTPPDTAAGNREWSWEVVEDTSTGAEKYLDLAVRSGHGDSAAVVYVTVAAGKEGSANDTLLYRYDTGTRRWRLRELTRSDTPRLVVVAADPYLYVLHGGRLALYEDGESGLRYVTDLMDRMRDENWPSFVPNDVLLTQAGERERLWVATPVGLYYSSVGLYDRAETEQFTAVRRSRRLATDLEETYAYPSIITADDHVWGHTTEAVFAYSLGEADNVTIDIFDWNMDHVVRIIDDEHRPAGGPSRRSTNQRKDRWDGTFDNRGSKPVAPGVYYYRIMTRKGKRAFGKVIVARN